MLQVCRCPLALGAVRMPFVPDDFDPPRELSRQQFHLVPLDVEHNESDHAAWTSSIAHIRSTPGYESRQWPPSGGMPLEENRRDLARHARDFVERRGFTFTVLKPATGEVIGCVYIYPATDGEHDAEIRSWVRADVGPLDSLVHSAVSQWIDEEWPFQGVRYADRPS